VAEGESAQNHKLINIHNSLTIDVPPYPQIHPRKSAGCGRTSADRGDAPSRSASCTKTVLDPKTEIGRYAALGVTCEIVFRDGEQITVYGSIMGTLSPPPNDQTSDNGSSCYPAFPARARRRLGTNSRNWRALQSVGRAS